MATFRATRPADVTLIPIVAAGSLFSFIDTASNSGGVAGLSAGTTCAVTAQTPITVRMAAAASVLLPPDAERIAWGGSGSQTECLVSNIVQLCPDRSVRCLSGPADYRHYHWHGDGPGCVLVATYVRKRWTAS